VYEYRHVVLPQDIAKRLPKDKLLSEAEWRALGVQQSRGWGEQNPPVVWVVKAACRATEIGKQRCMLQAWPFPMGRASAYPMSSAVVGSTRSRLPAS
jgi:hypothetical protein